MDMEKKKKECPEISEYTSENGFDEKCGDSPLISVIVPIYNVEKYVRKCLDSLLHQTMKQIEVICIDDGSIDSSGRIADEYESSSFPIFRVIHTENRGLSSARNRGIDEAKTEWIMFVDSDDWVEPEFCRIPYEAALKQDSDLVIFHTYTWSRRNCKKSKSRNRPVGIVDEFTAHKYGSVVAWNKLYGRKLWKTIRYSEGRVYEDAATTHKLVHKAGRIEMLSDVLYHHEMRKDSISHTHSKANKRDGLVSAMERVDDLISYGYPEEKINSSLCGPAVGYLASTKKRDDLYDKAVQILDETGSIPDSLSEKQKIAFLVWKIDRRLFYLMSRITGRMDVRETRTSSKL